MQTVKIKSNDYTLSVLHVSQFTIGHTMSSQSITAFTSCCLVAASNGRAVPDLNYELLTTTAHN
jgi:hypothetical protein